MFWNKSNKELQVFVIIGTVDVIICDFSERILYYSTWRGDCTCGSIWEWEELLRWPTGEFLCSQGRPGAAGWTSSTGLRTHLPSLSGTFRTEGGLAKTELSMFCSSVTSHLLLLY